MTLPPTLRTLVPALALGALCSGRLAGMPLPAALVQPNACTPTQVNEITLTTIGGSFRSVTDASTGSAFFATGQNADILVSGIDFNNTGGSLLFNHPGSITSDGTKVAITDTFNNRVLIWNAPPAANVAPDVVVGQDNFTTNNPGTGRNRMNWPMSVWMAGGKLFVTDTNNERLMIWNSVPASHGASADVIINRSGSGTNTHIRWPWGIWSDGTKMVVGATQAARVLVWNSVPTADDTAASFAVEGRDSGGQARLGTPRHVFSNGTSLWVGDHNATVPGMAMAGTFVWNTFPTSATSPYSFFRQDYVEPNQGPWMKGAFFNGALWTFGKTVYKWNTPPASDATNPDLQLSIHDYMMSGDYGGVAFAGGKMYLASGNGNRISGFSTPPVTVNAVPDFSVGSPDNCTNTLDANYIIQNGVPRSNGTSLFVSSDFDRKLYVWSSIPDQSNPTPSYIYRLPFQPWASALHGNRLALAGERSVAIWETLPNAGAMPTRQLRDTIGSVSLQNIKGVAIDATNFYLADGQANQLHVWSGLPTASSSPSFTMNVPGVLRISSDGSYLAVVQANHQIYLYQVAGLNANSMPVRIIGGVGVFNLPQDVYVGNGRLFVADSGFNRVVGWTSLASAIAGGGSDLVIGETSLVDQVAEIGRNKTFGPGAVFYDGRFLWVGELKFSDRLLRYSPPCSYHLLSAVSQSMSARTTSGSVVITPNDDTCAWTAASNSSFLTVTSGAGGTGSATVTFTADSNTTGAPRTGTLTIGGRTFTVTQNRFLNGDAFTDDPLTAGVSVIKAVHVIELRARVNALRQRAGLSASSFTDSSLTAGSTPVKAVHVAELRTALAQAYAALGATPTPTYTNPSLSANDVIRRVHITELRSAVVALEVF